LVVGQEADPLLVQIGHHCGAAKSLGVSGCMSSESIRAPRAALSSQPATHPSR
jgi:hypothetical protein